MVHIIAAQGVEMASITSKPELCVVPCTDCKHGRSSCAHLHQNIAAVDLVLRADAIAELAQEPVSSRA